MSMQNPTVVDHLRIGNGNFPLLLGLLSTTNRDHHRFQWLDNLTMQVCVATS